MSRAISYSYVVFISFFMSILTACSDNVVSQSEFEGEYYNAICSHMYECDRESFDDEVSSIADCRAQFLAQWGGVVEYQLSIGCTYDSQRGQACIDAIDSLSCQENFQTTDDICDLVMECPMFSCADGSGEILEDERCNGYANCPDSSDEENCQDG